MAMPTAAGFGWAGLCVGVLLRHKSTHTPTPDSMTRWCSICDGGAQGVISTGSKHRRRNCSPAWLLAPRSAQRSQSEAEDGTEDRLGDSGDKVG